MMNNYLSDDFRQECTLIMSGQHPLCTQMPSKLVESVVVKELKDNQRVNIHITTLNCAGRKPEGWGELVAIFK